MILTSLNEVNFMDIINLPITNWNEQTVKFQGKEVGYLQYEYPWGILLATSNSIRRTAGVMGDTPLSSNSHDLVEKVVNYYKIKFIRFLKTRYKS